MAAEAEASRCDGKVGLGFSGSRFKLTDIFEDACISSMRSRRNAESCDDGLS